MLNLVSENIKELTQIDEVVSTGWEDGIDANESQFSTASVLVVLVQG